MPILIIILLWSCNSGNRPTYINLDKNRILIENQLKGENVDEIDLCKSFNFEWDSIIVIRPYTPKERIKRLNISNLWVSIDSIENHTFNDTKSTLLFIYNGHINYWGSIPDLRFRFHMIATKSPIDFPIIQRLDCVKKIKKAVPGGDMYYTLK